MHLNLPETILTLSLWKKIIFHKTGWGPLVRATIGA